MLPRILNAKGIALGLLVLCVGSEFVTAGSIRSNILTTKTKKSSENADNSDCNSCNSVKACALRQFEQRKCATEHSVPACMTVYNDAGLVKQRGCSAELLRSYSDYCDENPAKCIQCDKGICNDPESLMLQKLSGSVTRKSDATYECYKCEGDCEDIDVVPCNSEGNDMRCYTRFQLPINVVGMGCISDFDNEQDIISLVKEKLLYICEGDKCNGYEHLPTPHECSTCKSDNIEYCATIPSFTTTTTECNLMPYTECYQRVNNQTNGITERGCLSSLEGDDFWNCLIANDGGDCKICTGDQCNIEVIPSNRPKCHRCDSSNDANCEQLPDSLSVCPVYNKAETCVATFDSGVTKRGCSADFDCDPKTRTCQKCSGDGCNIANLKKRAQEIYGIFQELPLNCYTCEGDECKSGVGPLRKCDGDPYQDCLTVFDANGEVVSRGCEFAVQEEHESHCESNPELCFNCKSNGCNTMSNSNDYHNCLYCDSAFDVDCLFKPETVTDKRKCVNGCVASLYSRKTNPKVHDFVRTCFEDIEIDDQPECTRENNCVRCEGNDDCNTDILPESRLSCLYCDGDDCALPQAKTCAAYSLEDQCYLFFDNVTYSVQRAGCISDLLPNQMEDNLKQYFLCDGDNCNDKKNVPEAKTCFVCNSADDVNCAINPSKITSKSSCQTYPYTECYSRITNDGHTERGCLYSMATEDFTKCIKGDPDEICKICTESECNAAIYPGNRQKCHRCNSLEDPKCESEPKSPQICPTYLKEDACVTKLDKGVTYRGCLSELSCEGSSRKHCNTCINNLCNVIDLSAISVGDPGQFQELPLNCYHCDGKEDCGGTSLGLIRKCELNDLQTCTVAFDNDGSVVARGCSDKMDPICEGDGNMCFDCKSNACNDARQESDFIDCVFCDAQENERCIFEVDSVTRRRKCHKGCMTALYPRTNDSEPAYELIRTCLDDLDLDDREDCAIGKSELCNACTEENCNIVDLGERKSCYHCKDDDCQEPKIKTCRATMYHDQCFIEYDEKGAPVEMGCKSNYDPQDVKILLYAKRIWLCDEDNCNDIENVPAAQRCTICNSRTDKNCAINPTELQLNTLCSRQPYTACYMRILEDGHTDRGCLSELEDDNFVNCLNSESGCFSCSDEICNTKVYPADRLSCHICNSSVTASCERSPDSSQICLKYSTDQQCISLLDENGNTIRGCSSELTCDSSDSSTCRTCDGNDCNRSNIKRKIDGKPGMWQELPLKCHTCDSVSDCSANSKETTCEDNEYCMTIFDTSGAVQKRGCSEAVESQFGEYCDDNSANCYNCNSNNCNSAKSINDYVECVYCDSETNPKCVYEPEAIANRRMCNGDCMIALYPKENSSAYALTRTCLDDKDEVDRAACKAGDEHCSACDGEACNTDQFPADRWSCYVCLDEDCEDYTPQTCQYYKKNEQCFMLFGNQNNVLRMGCVSDLDDSYLADNIDSLFLCNEDSNCNSYENIPKFTSCIECDSFDDPDCASYPDNAPFITSCATLPNTQCFTQVYSDGSTKRGCVSKLTKSQRLSCLSGESENCISCNKDGCNNEIYPADRRRCHRCNSNDNPNCEYNPNSEEVCPFYSKEEFCSTKLVYGETYRGCSSDFQCDVDDYTSCRMCKGTDNCNTVDLKSLDIGYPGKWQGLPLNCYICQGDECKNNFTSLNKCENNNLQNCVTIFAEDGSVMQRGCSAQIYQNAEVLAYCDTHSDHCKFCKSNGCNIAESTEDFVDCIFCDGTENGDCVGNVADVTRRRSCHKKCMSALYPRKDEQNPAFEMSRGCLDDLDLDDREACENGDKALCKACEGADCNSVAIPDEPRLKCNTCDGDDCTSPKSKDCLAYREHDQCYALFEYDTNKVLRMGCASDLDNSDLVAQKRSLFLCDTDDCNESSNFPKPTGCAICNSKMFPYCATNPKDSIIAAGCDDLPYTQCYTRVDEEGITYRGCLSDVNDDVFDECIKGENEKCLVCDQHDCNTEIFPENRRSCHRCDSNVNAACEDSPQEFTGVCPLYNETDRCVTKVEGSRTLRGCATDFTCDDSNSKTCRICDSDNCNSVNLLEAYIGDPGKWQGLPLNCYTCEDEECTDSLGLIRKCEGNNLQTCMTVFGSDGVVVKRGCSNSVEETHAEYCEANSDKCFACKSNGCNIAKSLTDYTDCYFCDSAEGKNCSIDFKTTTRTRKCHGGCMVALYPRTNADDPAYEMSRSCLDDMDFDDREKCEAGEIEFCKACGDARCNTMSLPEERHECLRCSDNDCEDYVAQKCNAYHPNDQCYILYDNENSIANMGCRSDFEMDVVTDLIKQKRLILCDGKNCNTPEIVQTKSCLICDSSDDPRCATNPNLVDNSQRCAALPYTDCFTRINEDGHTIRGCMSSLPSEEFYGCLMNSDGLCGTCSKDNCNAIDVFPENRLRCQQCDSNSNEKCEASPDSNRVCPIYDEQDTCVTNLYNGITYRGCASSLKCYDDGDKRNCRTCKTSGCNTVDLVKIGPDGEPGKWQDVPLTCLVCTNEEDCLENAAFRNCEDNLYQNCMTVFNVEGKVVERGCSDVVEAAAANKEHCDANPDLCLRCNSNGCNVATSLDEYVECLACDTNVNGDCVDKVAGVTKTRKCFKHCMTALYPRDNETNPAYNLARSCLDDMDIDDREACVAGEKEYCEACTDAKCNIADIPDTRLSCLMCDGENCQLPEQKICPAYRENDQCYIQYNENHLISDMGCRSKFTNSEADFLYRQKRLYLCTGDNCNDIEDLPKEQTCTICSSHTDIACATNPETLITSVRCNVPPFTECYSRVLFDGSTERGCLSNLYDDEFLHCVGGNSTHCNACKGDGCNMGVFPENRARCHICDSNSDPNCEGRPDNVAICPTYDEADTCLTVYRDGQTLRGCSSSLTCDGVDSRGCSRCSGVGCNTINLAKRQDDNFGKWQDLPLSCYVCSGDECSDRSTATLETCENNNEQDCMVVFDGSGVVIERGCADNVELKHGTYCDENEDHCINCKSNECNVADSLSEFNECVYCDTHKDLSCLWQPNNSTHKTRMCRGGCMTALYPSDASSDPAYDLIRTCLDDKDSADQTKCSNGRDANCKACTGDSCNVDELPEDRLSCMHCANGDCEEPVSMKCPLYKQQDKCYIWFDSSNSISDMGCVSSFRNQELESLIKTKRIYICDEGENCNSPEKLSPAQKCTVCQSSNDVLCAVNAKAVGTFDECNIMPYTGCYSILNNDGTTNRGCLTDLSDDNFVNCVLGKDDNCETCIGDGCNREVFPADRQQCHTCTSLDDPDCESFPTHKQPCPLVTATESCKTALSGNETVRGCSSEIYCDASDSKTCRSCFGTSCNSIDLRNKIDDGYHGAWQELPLRCHECIGEHCQASLGPSVTCMNNIEQDCMTVFESNGTVRRRGCTDKVEDYEDLYCRLHPHLCFRCKSNECNFAWSISEFIECSFCNSTQNPKCITNPDSTDLTSRQCLNKCMVSMKENGEVIRSCLDDKEIFSQINCRDEGGNSKECESCPNNNCNTFAFPSDRLKCHECVGTGCSSSVGQYCLKYDENDSCFAKYEEGKVDLMGCASSQNKSDLDEWMAQKRLFLCQGDDCNDLVKLPSNGECLVCDSSKTLECAQNPTALDRFEVCDAPYNKCVTYVNEGGHTIRGCLSKLDQTEQESCERAGTCASCTGDKCNSEVFPNSRRKCHICNSIADDKCAKSPDSLMICPIYVKEDRCVARYDGNVDRGCESSFTCDTENTNNCQICDTDGCNTADFNGSAIISGSLLFASILAFFAIRGSSPY